MIVKSHKPCQVVEVMVRDHDSVVAGQSVLRLDGDTEERSRSRLHSLIGLLAPFDNLYSSDQQRRRHYSLEAISSSYEVASRVSEVNIRSVRDDIKVGQKTSLDLLSSIKDLIENNQKLISSRADEKILDRDFETARDVIALVKSRIAEEMTYVDLQISRLVVKAPVSGRVELSVVVGSLINLRGKLFEII